MNYISMVNDEGIIRDYLIDNYITDIKPMMRQNARLDAMKRHWAVNEIMECLCNSKDTTYNTLSKMSKEFHHYAHIAPMPRQVMTFTCACDIIDDCLDVLRAKGGSK